MEMVQQQTRKKPAKPASLEQEFRGVFVIIELLGTGVSVVCHAHGTKPARGLPSLPRSFVLVAVVEDRTIRCVCLNIQKLALK